MHKNDKIRTTPLRNGKGVNKPFKSPLLDVNSTPDNPQSPKNVFSHSPVLKNATPKRCNAQFRSPIKRRRIQDALPSNEDKELRKNKKLLALKQRVRDKQHEVENLRTDLNYIKKHKDLVTEIEKWHEGCKEALLRLQKDVRDRDMFESGRCTLRKIMFSLEIDEDLIQFTDDED